MAESNVINVDFDLARGFSTSAPRRSLSPVAQPGSQPPGPLYREMENLKIDAGFLEQREAFEALGALPTIELNTGYVDFDGVLAGNSQYPLIIRFFHANPYNPDANAYCLVVTTREIFWWSAGVWINLTPVYTVGTASWSSASDIVTGTSTFWSDENIARGQIIKLGSEWKIIDGIASNTSLQLTSNPSTTSAGSVAYTIRRCFGNHTPIGSAKTTPVFAKVFNGDLFVAGTDVGGNAVPAVVKVTDVFRAGVAATDADYIYGKVDFGPGAAVNDTDSGLTSIHGLEALEDGRMVIPVRRNVGGSSIANRVIFCSHLDHTVWTASPGGFTDRVELQGSLTGSGRIGQSVVIHSEYGLSLGSLTGISDAPLSFREVAGAPIGASAPMSIRETPVGQIYLGTDFTLYRFDGARAEPVSAPVRDILTEPLSGYHQIATAAVDSFLGHYRLLMPRFDGSGGWFNNFYGLRAHTSTTTTNFAQELIYNYLTGAFTRNVYAMEASAISDDGGDVLPGGTGTGGKDRSGQLALIGVPSRIDSTNTDMLYTLKERSVEATLAEFTGNSHSMEHIECVSDSVDGGFPGLDKAWFNALLWITRPQSEDLIIELSKDGGTTWVTKQVTITNSSDPRKEVVVQFSFAAAPVQAESIIWRFRPATAWALKSRPFKLRLQAQLLGETQVVT